MTPLYELFMQAVDSSIVETVAAFVRFRPGFHGDTGIRDYLYHRLMTNLPDSGTYRRTDGGGTLLAQAEWYTALKMRGASLNACSDNTVRLRQLIYPLGRRTTAKKRSRLAMLPLS